MDGRAWLWIRCVRGTRSCVVVKRVEGRFYKHTRSSPCLVNTKSCETGHHRNQSLTPPRSRCARYPGVCTCGNAPQTPRNIPTGACPLDRGCCTGLVSGVGEVAESCPAASAGGVATGSLEALSCTAGVGEGGAVAAAAAACFATATFHARYAQRDPTKSNTTCTDRQLWWVRRLRVGSSGVDIDVDVTYTRPGGESKHLHRIKDRTTRHDTRMAISRLQQLGVCVLFFPCNAPHPPQ